MSGTRTLGCSLCRSLQPRAHGQLVYRAFAKSARRPAQQAIAKTQNENFLGPLPRPLGVRDPPLARPPTQDEKKKDFVNWEKHLEKRKMLVKEATRGYFHDINAMKHHGGKLWTAPPTLIKQERALYFPTLWGKNLLRTNTNTTQLAQNRISLIQIIGTQVSAEHTATFIEPLMQEQLDTKDPKKLEDPNRLALITVNLQSNPLKSLLVNLFSSSLRTANPRAMHPRYILSSEGVEYLRLPLGIENATIGYVYLVDRECKIRWAACGYADKDELVALAKCLGVLLERSKV